MTDSTANDLVIPIGDTNVNLEVFSYVDPLVDLWFAKRGRVSRRRFLNMARMRYRAMCRRCNLDIAWIRQFERRLSDGAVREYVLQALSPSYAMRQPRPDPFFDPPA